MQAIWTILPCGRKNKKPSKFYGADFQANTKPEGAYECSKPQMLAQIDSVSERLWKSIKQASLGKAWDFLGFLAPPQTSFQASTMHLHNLKLLLALLLSTAVYAVPSALDLTCRATPYVLLSTYHSEPYLSAKHGATTDLRIYDHQADVSCYQKIWSSSSTDLQLRSTSIGLSTFVYRRGLFSWALSLIKFAPLSFGGGTFGLLAGIVGIVGCTLKTRSGEITGLAVCITGSALSLIGGALGVMSAANTANKVLQATAQTSRMSSIEWLNAAYELTPFKERREIDGPEVQAEHSGMYHAHDHSEATWIHMVLANETHPINIYHHGKYASANATLKMWSSLHEKTHADNVTNTTLRFHFHAPFATNLSFNSFPTDALADLHEQVANERAPGSMGYAGTAGTKNPRTWVEYLGQEKFEDDITLSSVLPGAPSGMYYGYDFYGDLAHQREFDADLGIKYDASNKFVNGVLAVEKDMFNRNAWDECVCMQTDGQWISTGSMQMTWDNGKYNGNSACYQANCHGA